MLMGTETGGVLRQLTSRGSLIAWQAGGVAVTLVAGVLTAVLTHAQTVAAPGHLATLLNAHRASVLADHVASAQRGELTATRLSDAWSVAIADVGALRRVTHHYVVREGGGAQDELEVLQFADGGGVLTARRTPAGITGLVLLVGAAGDPADAAVASAYANDLATGELQPLRAKFDVQMASALPADLFTAETAAATAGLQRPATVAGQIVVRRGALTVIETYLLFRNGLRRVEMTLQPNGSIAGLYIRPL